MEDYMIGVLIAGGVLVVVLSTVVIVYASSRCYPLDEALRLMDLNAPLLPNSTAHRLDAALREASEGYSKCPTCSFANFKRFPFCNLCGERLPVEETEERARAAAETEKRASSWTRILLKKVETQAPVASPRKAPSAGNSLRLQRARQRQEWARRLDVDRKLFWFRSATESTSERFPGLVVRFEAVEEEEGERLGGDEVEWMDTDATGEGIRGVVSEPATEHRDHNELPPEDEGDGGPLEAADEAALASPTRTPAAPQPREEVAVSEMYDIARDLEQLVASLQLSLVDAAAANPARLALPRNSVGRLPWKNTLLLAAQAFTDKYAHFVTETAALLMNADADLLKIRINRETLLEDSIEVLSGIPVKHVHAPLRIHFVDELGVDAGGLYREWFVMLCEQLADPTACGIFRCVNKVDQSFSLNPNSRHDIGEDHLRHFYAAGRFVGRALLEGMVLSFHLTLPLLKTILGVPVSFSDLEYFDPEAYKSMLWLLENDGVESLGLDFSVTEKRGDEVVTVDLVPNGRNVDVTDANKREYLERKFRYLLFESVSSQLLVFLKGLYEVIPQELLLLFDPEEFDYLLCGSDEIDVDDWERNTKYTPNLHDHRAMRWFWEIVREMPNEYRRRLLHFATGSSRVPIAGFSGLTSYDGRLCPFTLKDVELKDDGYIWSHACFNRLDLPLHVFRDELKAVMYAAVETDVYGFTTH